MKALEYAAGALGALWLLGAAGFIAWLWAVRVNEKRVDAWSTRIARAACGCPHCLVANACETSRKAVAL